MTRRKRARSSTTGPPTIRWPRSGRSPLLTPYRLDAAATLEPAAALVHAFDLLHRSGAPTASTRRALLISNATCPTGWRRSAGKRSRSPAGRTRRERALARPRPRRGASSPCSIRDAEAFCFQTATDDPKIKATYPIGADGKRKDPLARVINLPPDNLEALATRNTNGAAVWVMVNEGDGKGRTEVERHPRAQRVRGSGRRAGASGHERAARAARDRRDLAGQVPRLWLVDGLPLDQFEAVQRRIATMFDGDSICDLPRVMRLPGMIHAKDPAKPFLVRIVHQAERLPYTAADILRAFPPLEDSKPKATGNGRTDLPDPLAPDRLAELKAAHPRLFDARCYKSTSERDFALACLACKLGWPDEDAVALIRAVQDGAKRDRADYCWRTALGAYAKAGGATTADRTGWSGWSSRRPPTRAQHSRSPRSTSSPRSGRAIPRPMSGRGRA